EEAFMIQRIGFGLGRMLCVVPSRRAGALCVAMLLTAGRVAAATDSPQAEEGAPPPVEGPSSSAAASAGAFLPLTVAASSQSTYGTLASGYEGARKAMLYQGYADAHVVGGLSIRAGYASHDLSGDPTALFGARYQLLRQDRHGFDLGVGLFYMPQDIDGEG